MNTPCCTSDADIPVIRGNNYPPMIWQFLSEEDPDVLFDLTGSVFKLNITWPGGTVHKSSDVDSDLALDIVDATLTWTYTEDWSRSLPFGRSTRYEIERWIDGTQQTLVRGNVIVSQGDNPD